MLSNILETSETNKTCYDCGKKDNFICQCKYNKRKKVDNSNDTNNEDVIESEVIEIITMISEITIGMIIELSTVAVTKISNW